MLCEQIETKLLEVLDAFANQLPRDDVSNIRELVEAGEWGVGFEILCTQLYEYDVEIPRALFHQLESIGHLMQMDKSTWCVLRDLLV